MTIDDLAVEAGLFLKEGELLFNFHEDSRTQLQRLAEIIREEEMLRCARMAEDWGFKTLAQEMRG